MEGKEASNLVSLLSRLFIFGVISSTLAFDYIRLLLEDLSESNTELLLRIVRDCGPNLLQDDPSALKSIVEIMRNTVLGLKNDGKKISVRTDFMIETINDLRNHKARKTAAGSAGVSEEHVRHMKKLLGTLNQRARATEPLRIGRDDFLNSEEKGKWWLIGARPR
ncbi:nuclear protein [Lasallia pustulata]|uniref:Nuclear protein n=1 Tax=Lasallia pustulata TaxID=136370 RepID=A0A1W5D4X1_9LECA|nr:nuclear protein [Lasallia pustulata]